MKPVSREKGQGIVEYALLLAFVAVIAAFLYTSGFADSIKNVFDTVSTTISDPVKGQDKAYANRMAELLKKGIKDGTIKLTGNDSYVAMYAQDKENPRYNNLYINGAGSSGYGGFKNLWDKLDTDGSVAKDASVHQSGINWYGVQVKKNSDGSTYTITYVEGSGYNTSDSSRTTFDDKQPTYSEVLDSSWKP